MAEAAKPQSQPQTADAANVDALKDYGFKDFEEVTYTRDADKLKVRAIRFDDATGAYGAYTFYRQSGMPKEEIGQGGASNNNRVLFWTGNTVVDATFDHVTSMSASELRELAKNIPAPSGSANVPPPFPAICPLKGWSHNPPTIRWAISAIHTAAGCCRPHWWTSEGEPRHSPDNTNRETAEAR